LKTLSPNILLTPIDHKNTVKLSNGIELLVASQLSKNVREALPQIGKVVAIFEGDYKSYENDVCKNELEVGDIVVCTHFAFYETTSNKIGTGYLEREYVDIDGVKCYSVDYREIYFKIAGNDLIPLNNFILVEGIYEESFTSSFLITTGEKKLKKDKAKILELLDERMKQVDSIMQRLQNSEYEKHFYGEG